MLNIIRKVRYIQLSTITKLLKDCRSKIFDINNFEENPFFVKEIIWLVDKNQKPKKHLEKVFWILNQIVDLKFI